MMKAGFDFGSKNLRAIAVKGNDKAFMKQADEVMKLAKWFNSNWKDHAGLPGFGDAGTGSLVAILDGMGILPTHNFQKSSFDQAAEIDGAKINAEIRLKREACYACPVKCKQVVKHESEDPNRNIDPAYGAPEYETLGMMGSNCLIDNVKAINYAAHLCNMWSIDTMDFGGITGFVMEAYEKGFITKDDLQHLQQPG